MKADGIQSKPGYDFVEGSDDIIEPLERYESVKGSVLQFGWLMGPSLNVDDVMATMTRIISLWRRDDFMEHGGYEWAAEFEEFANWARRFVIRGIPYSEMKWNHSSNPVCGMDAVVLLRSMPLLSAGFRVERVMGLARSVISWKVPRERNSWLLGDLFDRSQVGELPLCELVELKKETIEDGEELTIYGLETLLENAGFYKKQDIVSMQLKRVDNLRGEAATKYFRGLNTMRNGYRNSTTTVTVRTSTSDIPLLTYRPFTYRLFTERALRIGDASLRPAAVPSSVAENMQLKNIGICDNDGICERVYAMDIDGQIWPLSTSEVNVILAACNSDIERCKAMAISLKKFCSYKAMKYKDLSREDIMYCMRGRRVGQVEAEDLNTSRFLSGEIDRDIGDELIDILRSRYDNHTFVWVDRAVDEKVQVVFRGQHHITRITTEHISTNRELAILEETAWEKFVNCESTGLLQMAAGIQPEVQVKEYGSGLNPRIQADENGLEVHIEAVNGIFSTCTLCEREVCNINGLVAKVSQDPVFDAGVFHVQWLGQHDCTGQVYQNMVFTNGSRIV